MLVHDTNKSHSLLGLLGMKDRLFLDTSSHRPPNLMSSYAGLVGMVMAGDARTYVPNFNVYEPRKVSFQEWWVSAKRRAASSNHRAKGYWNLHQKLTFKPS